MQGQLSYIFLLTFITFCLLLYVGVALANMSDEPYFFFTWFVFSRVPEPDQVSHEILLTSVSGTLLSKPLLLRESKGIYAQSGINIPEFLRRTELFARDVIASSTRATQDKVLIDELITSPLSSYELVEVEYDPIARYEQGVVKSIRVLGEFQKI